MADAYRIVVINLRFDNGLVLHERLAFGDAKIDHAAGSGSDNDEEHRRTSCRSLDIRYASPKLIQILPPGEEGRFLRGMQKSYVSTQSISVSRPLYTCRARRVFCLSFLINARVVDYRLLAMTSMPSIIRSDLRTRYSKYKRTSLLPSDV